MSEELSPEERYLIGRKSEWIMGPTALIMTVMYQGGLSDEELARFCLTTPNGQALYGRYKAYASRARERGEKNYDYLAFAREILAENPNPIA